jgi:hypothetical protein
MMVSTTSDSGVTYVAVVADAGRGIRERDREPARDSHTLTDDLAPTSATFSTEVFA